MHTSQARPGYAEVGFGVNVAEASKKIGWLATPAPEARQRVSLGLGCVVVAETPSVVRTVLGSCVAVILHVPRLRISALCHAQMPERHSGGRCLEYCPKPCYNELPDSNEFKYVTCCVRYMLLALRRLHVAKQELVSTVVGGANVLKNIDPQWSVASRNVSTAMAILEQERIPVAYADTGGIKGRVIEHVSDVNRTKVRYHSMDP